MFRRIPAVYYDYHMKDLLPVSKTYVRAGGTHSYHSASNGYDSGSFRNFGKNHSILTRLAARDDVITS